MVFGSLAGVLMIEAILWVCYRAPTEHTATLRLKNSLPGLTEKVNFTIDAEHQLRSLAGMPLGREPNTVRIFCVGGLATFGQLQNAPQTWWGQLGVALQEKFPGVKIEIGANGSAGLTGLAAARWVSTVGADFSPDIIISNLGAGEVLGQPLDYKYDAHAFEGITMEKRERGAIKSALLQCSQIARWQVARNLRGEFARVESTIGADDFFKERFEHVRTEFAKLQPIPNPFRLSDADPRNEYLDAIKLLHGQAQKLGAQLILTGEPCLCRDGLSEELEKLRCTCMPKSRMEGNLVVKVQSGWVERELHRFQEAAQEYATAHQLTFLDLNGEVPPDAAHFFSETILTDAGAQTMAELLLPKVVPAVQKVLKK